MNINEEPILQASKKDYIDNNRINSTNYLIEDSFGMSHMKNPYTMSAINRRFNNTQNLLHDKTSFLLENNLKETKTEKLDEEEYLRTSFVMEDNQSKIKENVTCEEDFNNFNDIDADRSLLSLSEDTISLKRESAQSAQSNFLLSKHQMNQTNQVMNLVTVNKQIQIDKSFLDFGVCFPNENLRKIIKIKNESKTDKTVLDIKFCRDNKIEEYFSNNNNSIEIENSFLKFNCFSLKNDESLFETKISLKESEELEIEIVLKTPFVKNKKDLFGVLQIINNTEIISNIKLLAKIEIPKLLCLKVLNSQTNSNDSEAQFPLISIMLEIKSKGQKFRLPFKNLSIKDMEVEFLLDQSNSNSIFILNDNYYECQFLFFPNKLQIQAFSTSAVDLIAKIKRIKLDENVNKAKVNKGVRKIIIAKIKNTTVYYTFFVEAHFRKVNSNN